MKYLKVIPGLFVVILLFCQNTNEKFVTEQSQNIEQPDLSEFMHEPSETVGNIERFFPYDTLDNWLTLSISQNIVLRKLGRPNSVGKDTYWGAIGTYVQEWNYLDQGISLKMESGAIGQKKKVLMISIFEPCKMKTSSGIGISSSREHLMKVYSKWINEDFSGDDQIVVGSIYGGVIFKLTDNKVIDIFIGAAAE